MVDDREALALTALCTPLVEAADALEVLVDALIEGGVVDPELPVNGLAVESPRGYSTYSTPAVINTYWSSRRIQAIAWARARLIEEIVEGCWKCRSFGNTSRWRCWECGRSCRNGEIALSGAEVVVNGWLVSTYSEVTVGEDNTVEIQLRDLRPGAIDVLRGHETPLDVAVNAGWWRGEAHCRLTGWKHGVDGTIVTLRGEVARAESRQGAPVRGLSRLGDVEDIVMVALRETPIAGARVTATRAGPGRVRVHVDAVMSPYEVSWLLERASGQLPELFHLEVTHATPTTLVNANRRYSA